MIQLRVRPRPPGGSAAALALAGAAALVLAVGPGDLAPTSLRTAAAACAVGAAALLARRLRPRPTAGRRLEVLTRLPLSRDAGLALVELDGRPLLLGFGPGGVQLLEDPPARVDGARLPPEVP